MIFSAQFTITPVPPTDIVQYAREAIVAALDTAPLVVAVTGRANGNVVAWDTLADDAPLPIAAYRITSAAPSGGLNDERKIQVTFRAVAETESAANTLLGAIEKSLTYPRLRDAAPALEAYRLYGEEDRVAADYDEDVEACIGDFDAVLIATNPTP
jgi:hypothetical protein